jgi:predicted ATPase/DNA-binding CsgD family transcriptional regulator
MAPILLERESVLAEMGALAHTAASGAGQMLLLRGEAGVGRTALLRGFIDSVSFRSEVLLGCCDPLSAPRALGPFIDMFTRFSAARATEMGAALDAGNSETVYKSLLETLADGRRWVCVIDDAHWADDATLDLLRFLARRIETLPVLVVVSYRDYELGQGHPLVVMLGDMSNNTLLTRISLSPLSIDAVAAMAAGTGADAEHLHMLTGGNPFYVNEILAANHFGSSAVTLPRSVAESAWGRLARLSAAAREAAEAVAVCGPDVDPRLVEALCSGAAAGLNECVRVGLLVASDDTVRFRHELIRLATLDQIPDYVRRGIGQSARAAPVEFQPNTRSSVVRPAAVHALAAVRGPQGHKHRADTRADPAHLTRREREILELLAVGHSDAEIANRLFISQRTVNNHVHAILNKLGAQNRTQAATYARARLSDTRAEIAEG